MPHGEFGPQYHPEAQYRQEFYRHMIEEVGGPVRFSPEFSSVRGDLGGQRIDFFLQDQMWGIELIRDGDGLRQSYELQYDATRAYGKWLTTQTMNDFIMLDFRKSRPETAHSGSISFVNRCQ